MKRAPLKLGIETQYYLKQPDGFGPERNVKVLVIPFVLSLF